MPELPEVETVRKTLEPLLKGLKIMRCDVYFDNMIKDIDFINRIQNQTIHAIKRMGKHLLFELDHDVMISHLRMEGKYFYQLPREKLKHEHVIFYLDNGYTLRYHDVRKFGTFHLKSKDTYLEVPPLKTLGLEPKDLDANVFYQNIHHKTTTIKQVLLDQTIISGLGNIYVDETLYRAGVHPLKKASKISLKTCEHIINQAREVLDFATSLGGSTIRSYYATIGISGKFQNELLVHTKAGEPCKRCQTKIIKMKVGGRGTYVCPTCQKR
jgi:formamidopyrimidine-DNA glycosylase